MEALIRNHPVFAHLSSTEVKALNDLLQKRIFAAGSEVVKENDIVDSIYFIDSGIAEVRKGLDPIALLNPGEVIGLSETGFYSTTGKRTATVVAKDELTAYQLKLDDFYRLTQKFPVIKKLFSESLDIFYRLNLIKSAAPFARMSIEKMRTMAEKLKKISYRQGEIIFHQGDPGDRCYLIEKGQVQIFTVHKKNEEHLAVLEPSMVFGEAAILMNLTRNASARALTDVELLMLDRDQFLEIVKTEKDVSHAMMTMMRSRCRPMILPNIEVHFRKTAEQEAIITLKNPVKDSYYRLAPEGWFIWELLDGRHTLHDITLAFQRKFGVFDPNMIATFIMDLEDSEFIEKCTLIEEDPSYSWWMKAAMKLRRIMEASVSFGNVDNWITKTYQAGVYLFYTKPARIVMTIIALLGFVFFVINFNHHVELFRVTPQAGWLILLAIVVAMTITIFHELAHAYTTKYFGRKVANFGVGWFWLGPVAFCDTSDMWLNLPHERVAVDLAGLAFDLFLAGFFTLMGFFVHNPWVALFIWLLSLILYLGIFKNLSPNIELDGYYTLMDLTGKDNLRESAIVWLLEDFSKTWRDPALIRKYKYEILYWVICIIYLILEIIIPYLVMNFLLYGLLGVRNPYLSLIAPLVVVTLSSISIWAEIKAQRTASDEVL